MLLRLTFVLLAAVLFAGCDKDAEIKCPEFRSALAAGDEEKILQMVNQYIGQSFLLVNSSQNFDKLAKYFEGHCNLEVAYKCFQCVDTNPPLSYMTVTFLNGPVFVQRNLVIWNDPLENRMKAIGAN